MFTSLLLASCVGNQPQLDPGSTGGGGAGGQGGEGAAPPSCGDGVLDEGEQCDDGNGEPGDGCRADCSEEACGDGIVDPGMTCFSSPISYGAPAGAQPMLVPLASEDRFDLVLAGSTLEVRLATGPGSFGGAVALGSGEHGVAAGALDGDASLDLAVVQSLTSGTYLNAGDGTFGTLQSGPTVLEEARVALGDLDDDGDDDLVVTGCANGCGTPTSSLQIALSLGNGGFGTPALIPSQASAQTLVRDVTGDGRADVVALFLADGGAIGVYPGDGAGGVGSVIDSVVPDNCELEHMDLGDVQGDGWLDAVVGSRCDAKPAYVLRGNGAGGFSEPAVLDNPAGGMVSTQFADLDNDGALDVVAGTLGAAVLFFRGDGDGGFAPAVEAADADGGMGHVATAHLDDDGALDLVVAGAGGLRVYLSNP